MTEELSPIVVLNKIHELMPPQKKVDISITKAIRKSLESHIQASNFQRSGGYDINDISVDIELMFETLSEGIFELFPLKISDTTVQKFMADNNFRSRSKGFGTTGASIRLIAAFLVLSKTNLLQLEDLVSYNLTNDAAKSLSKFIQDIDVKSWLNLQHVEGIYKAEWQSGVGEVDTIQLVTEVSADGSHLLVEEKYSSGIKSNIKMTSIRIAYGWCVLTAPSTLLLIVKDPKTGHSTSYSSLLVQHDSESNIGVKTIVLQRHDESYAKTNKGSNILLEQEFKDFVSKHQRYFIKQSADILTFEKPFDAKTRKAELSRMNDIDKKRSSAANIVNLAKKVRVMDDAQREQISKEMLNCIIDIRNKNEERFFELLDMGASINYRHSELGCTAMHAVGRFYPEFFEEVIKRSHENYNYLTRDNNGNLASSWAFDSYPQNSLYNLIREKEITYGKERGIWPDPIGDMSWNDVMSANPPKPPEPF